MLSDFAEKKETFFGYKKHNFSKSKKSHFSKGVNPWFWTKNANFFLSLRKRENFFDLKKHNFSKLQIMLSDFVEIKATPF